MSLPDIITRVDNEIEFFGGSRITEAEWQVLRRQLSASNTAALVDLLRQLVNEVTFYTYLKSNRDLIAEANAILKDYP